VNKYFQKLQSIFESGEDFSFLHTSSNVPYSSTNSFLSSVVDHKISAEHFSEFESVMQKNKSYFGYFGYELKNDLEDLSKGREFFIKTPNLQLYAFKKNEKFSSDKFKFGSKKLKPPKIKYLKSNMTKGEYIEKVNFIRQKIIAGDIYQANLTRKFYGEFEGDVNALDIFVELSKISPAPYSSFIKFGDTYIISSSPELFVKLDNKGKAVTCPINGSLPKGQSKELSESKKDMAENLMITDLMRNDFSRVCKSGSVKVEGLFETSEFETITHMHSTISGELREGEGALSLIKNSFPPGSMTGAPKIMAMEICSELEQYKRGIYSGILGYIGENGEAEFSVVIRTLIIQGDRFEFQVGGGIVYDSNPEKEWEETMTKAKAIAKALNIESDIAGL